MSEYVLGLGASSSAGFDVTRFPPTTGAIRNWNYYSPTYFTGSAVPNMVWQNTSSNATYCSASSALTSV